MDALSPVISAIGWKKVSGRAAIPQSLLDAVSNKFLSKVKVVAVGSALGNNEYMLPYQAYIAEKSYPFIREVFMINRESFSGLGSGFTAYVAGEIGQRVVLRSGLVPATMPIRLVQFKKE